MERLLFITSGLFGFLTVALGAFGAHAVKGRLQPRGASGAADDALRFVRALPVGAKERVVVVEHRGERWMLGVTAGGISTIAHWGGSPHSPLGADSQFG